MNRSVLRWFSQAADIILFMEKPLKQSIAGTHCILELYDCPYELLNDEQLVRDTLRQAARIASTKLLDLSSHKFDPHGITALGLLAESHIAIHTWPQLGYAAADVFTCGRRSDPQAACEYLAERLQAENYKIKTLKRGREPLYQPRKSLDIQRPSVRSLQSV